MFYFLCASHSTADPLKLPSAASSPLSPTVFFPSQSWDLTRQNLW